MKFGDKITKLRKEKKLTQEELAKAVGVVKRTILKYENEGIYPRKREVYQKLAKVLDCDIEYLLTDDEEFVIEAHEKYGSRGAKDAQELIAKASGLFAGGDITEEMKDEVMKALQDAYWLAKKINVKYTPKKYLKDE